MKETRSEKILLFVVHLSPKVEIVVHREAIAPFLCKKYAIFVKIIRETKRYEVRHYQCNG